MAERTVQPSPAFVRLILRLQLRPLPMERGSVTGFPQDVTGWKVTGNWQVSRRQNERKNFPLLGGGTNQRQTETITSTKGWGLIEQEVKHETNMKNYKIFTVAERNMPLTG